MTASSDDTFYLLFPDTKITANNISRIILEKISDPATGIIRTVRVDGDPPNWLSTIFTYQQPIFAGLAPGMQIVTFPGIVTYIQSINDNFTATINPPVNWSTGIEFLYKPQLFEIVDDSPGVMTSRMIVRPDGSVGIGTAIPGGKFEVNGGNDYTVTQILSGGSDKWSCLKLGTDTVKGTLAVAGAAGQFANDAVAGDIILRTESSSQKLFLNSGLATGLVVNGGNIGIDAINPGEKLQIDNGHLKIGTADKGIIFFGGGEKIIGTSAYGIDFQTANGTSRVMILNAGNVGIGVTNPGSKLDVNGNINITSGNGYRVNGTQVVGARQAAVSISSIQTTGTADSTYSNTEMNMLNNLKADVTNLRASLNDLVTKLSSASGHGLLT